MRFVTSRLAGLCGLLWTDLILARPSAIDFMSVRESVAKKYESEGEIPTEKYFREYEQSIVRSRSLGLGLGGGSQP